MTRNQTAWPIWTQNGLIVVNSRTDVYFGVQIETFFETPYQGTRNRQNLSYFDWDWKFSPDFTFNVVVLKSKNLLFFIGAQ